MNGILFLDKPKGMSSNQALLKVRRLYGQKKAGHCGTLDPMATGMLPICLGKATRLSRFMLNDRKAYLAEATFGFTSDTGDAEGELQQRSQMPFQLQSEQMNSLCAVLTGIQQQTPPRFSAIKVKGRRAYDLARQGKDFVLPARQIEIHRFTLLAHGNRTARFYIDCSKGTYIRALVERLGDLTGHGAYLSALRRVQVGPYEESLMHTLAELEGLDAIQRQQLLQPLDKPVQHLPRITLPSAGQRAFVQGQTVSLEEQSMPLSEADVPWRCYGEDDCFLGLAEYRDAGLHPKQVLV